MMTLFMTSWCKTQFENYIITTNMKSTGIHLLNYQSFRYTQPFSIFRKMDRANFAIWGPYSEDPTLTLEVFLLIIGGITWFSCPEDSCVWRYGEADWSAHPASGWFTVGLPLYLAADRRELPSVSAHHILPDYPRNIHTRGSGK